MQKHFKNYLVGFLLSLLGCVILAFVFYQIPAINRRLSWRLEVASAYMHSRLDPAGALPTALPTPTGQPTQTPLPLPSQTPTPQATATSTPEVSPTPSATPTALPGSVMLPPAAHEKQGPNACGAATLTMYLRFYGWDGDQQTVSDVIKPITADRNINVEELVYFVRNKAGWLNIEYRVGGSLDTLRAFLAAGVPVMIEESSRVEAKYARYDDDFWDGHYLLITGYDDAKQSFMTQDSNLGANRLVSYSDLDKNWQPFNRVFILVFRPEQTDLVKSLLGSDWDATVNRQRALDVAKAETQATPENPFAWFNLGSNLVYFEEYTQAAVAFDSARKIGWPQRMLRYQFSPFIAYFHANRNDDLMALTEYALKITDNSEEGWLWQGWGLYRQGKKVEAVEAFTKALYYRPGYQDAEYAMGYVQNN